MSLILDMNKVYGFEGEAKSKHGEQTYKLFADVFTARKQDSKTLKTLTAYTECSTPRYPSYRFSSTVNVQISWNDPPIS